MRILKFFQLAFEPGNSLKIEIHHYIHDDKEMAKLREELEKFKSGVAEQTDRLNKLGKEEK